jgi:hypothetical protein
MPASFLLSDHFLPLLMPRMLRRIWGRTRACSDRSCAWRNHAERQAQFIRVKLSCRTKSAPRRQYSGASLEAII